jgi:hypothetical protein
LVSVRRAAAQEAALGGGLRRHRVPNPRADAGALALAHASEERHHHVVGLGPWIHPTPDLGHPQLNAVVLEQRERQGELGAVEGPLRLPDNDTLEAAGWGAKELQEPGCLRPAFPGERPRLPDVEELDKDLAADRLNELQARRSCQTRDEAGSC